MRTRSVGAIPDIWPKLKMLKYKNVQHINEKLLVYYKFLVSNSLMYNCVWKRKYKLRVEFKLSSPEILTMCSSIHFLYHYNDYIHIKIIIDIWPTSNKNLVLYLNKFVKVNLRWADNYSKNRITDYAISFLYAFEWENEQRVRCEGQDGWRAIHEPQATGGCQLRSRHPMDPVVGATDASIYTRKAWILEQYKLERLERND